MTGFADIGTENMGDGFSESGRVVMTTYAVIADSSVIKRRARERKWSMASVALCGGRNVRRGFSDGEGAIVALAAASDDLAVVDTCGRLK